jgi:hypothetical protein
MNHLPQARENNIRVISNFAPSVVDSGGAPSLANFSANFRQKIKTALMVYSGAWGKLIYLKKPEVENLVALSL